MNCMNATKYEIDMLGVGAADALLVRFFDENDKAYIGRFYKLTIC